MTVKSSVLGNPQVGQQFSNISLHKNAGNFVWLSWRGETDANTQADSLIPPGNSDRYINPDNSSDFELNVGDWAQGTPGVKNSSAIRSRMDALLNKNIIIPVWNGTRGQGSNLDYQVEKFAVVSLNDYALNGNGHLSFTFQRFTRCYNHRPQAYDQTVETHEDTSIVFNLEATDADGDSLIYELLTPVQNGQIEHSGNQVTYIPSENYFGADQLTFHVHDGEQLSNIATVSINVLPVNDPPTADDKYSEGLEDTPIPLVFSGNDIEGDALSFAIATAPSNGTIEQSGSQFVYTPNQDFYGEDTFTYIANDGELNSFPATYDLKIIAVNDPPVAQDIQLETESAVPVQIQLFGTDVDSEQLEYTLLTQPAHGTVTGTGDTLEYVSEPAFDGTVSFTYSVSDGEYEATATVTIVVVYPNLPPEITSPAQTATPEQQSYPYKALAVDPNNDPLVFSLDYGPENMSVTPDGQFSWVPDQSFVQTVPTFNQQCYVVPTGAVKLYEEGDESSLSYISPLFHRVRTAIKAAGLYTSVESVAWHKKNNCLGCHVQTQSLLGLETSKEKAEIDEAAAAYLLEEILSSQQSDGSIRRSHPQYAKTQTAFALWALNHAVDRDKTYKAREKALRYMWSKRSASGDVISWQPDHLSGWFKISDSMTALVAQAAADFIEDSKAKGNLTSEQASLISNYEGVIALMVNQALQGVYQEQDENLPYVFKMMILGELLPLIENEALRVEAEQALAHLDSLLRSRQENDGGWNRYNSGAVGDPLTSSWVGIALNYLNPPITDNVVTANIEFLLDNQNPSGTWQTNSDLFGTHLATTSLVMAYLPVALEHLGNPDVRAGHILLTEGDGVHQLSAVITNRGLADITNPVTVKFYNGSPEQNTLLGQVQLDGIPSGSELRPSIQVNDEDLTEHISVVLDVTDDETECQVTNNSSVAALVRVRVTDPGELFDTQVFTLNVDDVNQAPVIESSPDLSIQQGQPYTYQVAISDSDVGDAHIFTIASGPQGLYIDPRTGRLTADYTILQPGSYDVVIRIQDLRGATTSQTFTLTVHENLPPEITSPAEEQGNEVDGYQYQVQATDPNPGDVLSYTLEQSPQSSEIGRESGLITWPQLDSFVDPDINTNHMCVSDVQIPVGEFNPVLKWHWAGSNNSYKQVMALPVVAQLNDDNGDGNIDTLDIPDVIFSAFSGRNYNNPGILRALSGTDGSEIWPIASRYATARHAPAVGDIDGDGLVEIVSGGGYAKGTKELVVYENDGTLKFSKTVSNIGEVALADLEGDGSVEIIMSGIVYDASGNEKWSMSVSDDSTIVVDLDLDGKQEVFGGGQAYDYQGNLIWQIPAWGRAFAAVGNFDEDDFPELVIKTHESKISLIEHDGTVKWGPVAVPGGGGGALTVADVDSDGLPEIGIAGSRNYAVFETDGSLKWASPTRDWSSSQTGSSVFDFEGDGAAEILYADEQYFRVYDGSTGEILSQIKNPSGTLFEYPLVVDVDNDNHAEIVVVSNNYAFSGTTGIRVFEDINDAWAPTRSIWNQHAYSINNINDDGSIPAQPVKSWLTHNTYRLNTFADRDALAQPDLVVHSITYNDETKEVSAKVKNRGLAPYQEATQVRLIHEHFWSGDQELGFVDVPALAADQEVEVTLSVPDAELINSIRAELVVSDSVAECVTDNNTTRASIFDVRVYDQGGLFDTQKYAASIENVNDEPAIISPAATTATFNAPYYFNVEVEDADKGDMFLYELVDAPIQLELNERTGRMVIDQLDAGIYTFTIRVTDLAGAVAEQPHVLTITDSDNQPPVFNSDPIITVTAGDRYVYDADATDPDGDSIVYFLSRSPHTMAIDGSTGLLLWETSGEDVGMHSVEVIALDSQGTFTRQYFLIDVQSPNNGNNPPLITSFPEGLVYAGQQFNYQVLAEDPDQDPLSYSLEYGSDGMAISEDGLFTWLPSASLIGTTAIVEIQVSDGRGGVNVQRLSLPVNESANNPPVITSEPSLSAEVDKAYSYDVTAVDIDGDSISFILEDAPNGMSLSGNQVSWVPSSIQENQVHTVVVRAVDARGAASIQSFGIAVNAVAESNTFPEIVSIPQSPAFIGETYTYEVIARDVDGDSLTYSLESPPTGMTLSDTGLLQWQPVEEQLGDHAIVIAVSDGKSIVTQSYTLAVVDANAANNNYPVITNLPHTAGTADYIYQHQMTAEDADNDPLTFGLASGPEGMSVTADGLVVWTPTIDQVGSHDVTLSVTDGKGYTHQSYSLTITDDLQPLAVMLDISPQYPDTGETVYINVFTSGGKGELTYELKVNGSVVELDQFNQAAVVAGAIGTYPVEVTVTDQEGSVSEADSFAVIDPNDTTAPEVTLISPDLDSQISAPVDVVATIQDENLASYQVLIAPKGTQEWQEIGEGSTNVLEQAVAQFDPSMLINGQYNILVLAKDLNGKETSDSTTVLVDGDLKVGNFSITFEDLNVPMAGIPLRVTRTYDSRRRYSDLDFGFGWTVGYQDVKVEESRTPGKFWTINQISYGPFNVMTDFCIEPQGAPVISVTLPDGDVERFEMQVSPRCNTFQVVKDVELVFEPTGDTQSTLEALGYNSARYENGTLLDKQSFTEPVNPDRYQLTTRTGYVYTLNQNFGVEKVVDPNGHTLTYTNDGIFHSSGKAITFTRDSKGRITEITDPKGQSQYYHYDGSGNLSTYSDALANDTTFTYNRNHGLLDIIDPLGRTVVKNIYDDSGRLIAQDDGEGNRTEFNHDIAGRQSIVTDRLGNTTFYYYDERGNVTAQVNALDERTDFVYDERGNQLSKTNDLGEVETATYNSSNDQLTQTDGEGNTVTFTYNSRGQELTITDSNNNPAYVNSYDAFGNLLTVKDPDGNVAGNNINGDGLVSLSRDMLGNDTTYTYDDDGNKLTETNPEGDITTYSYDENGNVLTESMERTLADGSLVNEVTTYEYDARNQLIATNYPDGTTTRTEYDALGNQVVTIDANNQSTTYEYDLYNRLTAIHYPDGTSTHSTYDLEGNKLTDTDQLNRETRYEYDKLNRLVLTVYPDLTEMRTEYDRAGRVSAEVDANGNRTTFGYDKAGRRIWVENADQKRHHFVYDNNGNLIEETDALGRTTRYTFNALDQRTHTIYHDLSEMESTLDAEGKRTEAHDQADVTTKYAYDTLGRLTKVTDALLGETAFTYDEVGNKLTQTDAEGRTTKWAYDSLGRVISRTLPLGQVETFTYDANGNQHTHTDFNGELKTFSYDLMNRLTRIDYADGSYDSYSYDDAGNRTYARNAEGEWYYHYDNRNRLSEEVKPDQTRFVYGYDNVGNRTSLRVFDSLNNLQLEQSFSYDNLNRLETVTDSSGTTTYGYDDVGNRTSISYGNGTSTTYNYDDLNRLTLLSHYDLNGALLNSFEYQLHTTGRREQISEANGRTTEYDYDLLYRLTEERITDALNGNYTASYQYDKVGNRTYETVDGIQTAYSYDLNDRIEQQGGTTYTYDDNGNTLTETLDGQVKAYDYNDRQQLIRVTQAGEQTEYRYNPDGIRFGKTDTAGQTIYQIDSNRDYAQVVLEQTPSDNVSYFYGDDLLSQNRNGATNTYHYDGLGSTRLLTDGTGVQSDSYNYEAFGELLNQTGSTDNSYLYTGEQYDAGLDQYYLRARYYDQGVGRFTQMDEFKGWSDDPVTLHKYLYANIDPANATDPSGYFAIVSFSPGLSYVARSGAAGAAVGYSAYNHILTGLVGAGLGYGLSEELKDFIALNAPVMNKLLEEKRVALQTAIERDHDSQRVVYHYTDRVAALSIFGSKTAFVTPPFRGLGTGGFTRPAGFYATDIAPWEVRYTQSELSAMFYGGNRNKDMSWFVAFDDELFNRVPGTSHEYVLFGSEAIGEVNVDPITVGPNLMLPK
ncbi:Ig-like domain-containing protein [Neptuniibacter sp. QD34_54]|uniref:Ig-like domain-containing protein n=1 Tax=Neptuniibacter sp. QD34_54 TaxID=3398208 RepID=UPI0039F53D96